MRVAPQMPPQPLQDRGAATTAGSRVRSGIGRVFAPSDDSSYIFCSGPSAPALVIDRFHGGAARVVLASEIDSLIGPPGERAKSIVVESVVGLINRRPLACGRDGCSIVQRHHRIGRVQCCLHQGSRDAASEADQRWRAGRY